VQIELPERLPPAVETNAYFVVVEALTNAAKHSGASKARVFVREESGLVIVEIADDGNGGAEFGKGSGLAGLRDRIEALDGQLRLSSPKGGPTWLRAEIPMPRDAK
jgi:signal transduction histidine kinase